jgi:hypothetical protein
MAYQGDIAANQVLYFTFTTNVAGVPTTLAGTPILSVYKDDSTTQTTTGLTLVADLDGVTGLNSIKVVTSDAFYAAGHDYSIVITTGTVGGVSAVGYTVGTFSIANRTNLTAAQVNAEIVDALGTDVLIETVNTDGSAPTLKQAIYAILQFLTEKSISGTTMTVKKVDGSTALMTFTLDSATAPTSITRAS